MKKLQKSFDDPSQRLLGPNGINNNNYYGENVHSDSEAVYFNGSNSKKLSLSTSLPTADKNYKILKQTEGNYTDEEIDQNRSNLNDEFGDHYSSRIVRTGRQRKKLAARSKGGEFQTRRRKKRVYFCCVSSEIDVQKLFDYLVGAGGLLHGWKYQLYNEVLHLYKQGHEELIPIPNINDQNNPMSMYNSITNHNNDNDNNDIIQKNLIFSSSKQQKNISFSNNIEIQSISGFEDYHQRESLPPSTNQNNFDAESFKISNVGAQEVFVFDFGVVVFWGFSRGEETNLLKTIRMFVTKG
jgi:uncharacterized Rmd1/YagE family protein